jgi:ATP-dependent transcriptional regulator
MNDVSSVRLMSPRATDREIKRYNLVNTILKSEKNFIYIHAGAGYGKTTLLSQIASSQDDTVWLTLAGESDILGFVNILTEAIRQSFPGYDFTVSEYLPFMEKDNFIAILANALIGSMEKLSKGFMVILDDLHSIKDRQTKEFLTCFMKYTPENIRLCLGSREAPWQEMLPIYIRGKILVLGQDKLPFTREEAALVLGSDDEYIYNITEGWPLAIGAFRILLENGVSLLMFLHKARKLYILTFFTNASTACLLKWLIFSRLPHVSKNWTQGCWIMSLIKKIPGLCLKVWYQEIYLQPKPAKGFTDTMHFSERAF